MPKKFEVVAVVENDPSVRRATGRLLSVLGYSPELYASGEEFLEVAITSKAVCLILDIELDGISGIELARGLRSVGWTTPIIFMTGDCDNESYKRLALEIDRVAFFYKPCSADAIIEALADFTQCP